jgi:hypothetical protein
MHLEYVKGWNGIGMEWDTRQDHWLEQEEALKKLA